MITVGTDMEKTGWIWYNHSLAFHATGAFKLGKYYTEQPLSIALHVETNRRPDNPVVEQTL